MSNTGKGAAGDIADHIAAGAFGRQADCVEGVNDLRQRFDREPVKLNVLADGYVGEVAGVLSRDVADDAKLAGGEDAVGNADAHHEVISGKAFAAFAAGRAYSVTLRVDSPPLEVGVGPLGNDARTALTGEGAHLVEGLPWVLVALQALRPLSLGFLYLDCISHVSSLKIFDKNRKPATAIAESRASETLA